MANPVLVQHVVTPSTIGKAVVTLYVSLPNPSLAGNLLICVVQFDAGSFEPTCADDQGQTYTGIMYAGGSLSCKFFYFLNSVAGVKKITLTWGGSIPWVQAMAAEFYNVATSSADVTSALGTGTSASWQATGTIAASASAGTPYLVYQAGFCNGQTTQSSFASRAGFQLGCSLLPGNTTDHGSIAAASQWGVVTASLTNPVITAGTSQPYSSIAVAFKSAAAGTAPTLTPRVSRVQYNEFDLASPIALQFPCHGQLLVGSIIDNVFAAKILVTGITDNHNTWGEIEGSPIDFGGAGRHQMLYAENAVEDDATMISLAYTGDIVGSTICLQEIVGANTYNNAAATSGTKDTTGNLPSVTITPAAAGHIIIAHCDHAEGTEFGCVADSNGHVPNFQAPHWGGDGDAISFFNHDSGQANFLTTETSDVQFIWSRSATAPGDWVALAAAFKLVSSTTPITVNTLPSDSLAGRVRF